MEIENYAQLLALRKRTEKESERICLRAGRERESRERKEGEGLLQLGLAVYQPPGPAGPCRAGPVSDVFARVLAGRRLAALTTNEKGLAKSAKT